MNYYPAKVRAIKDGTVSYISFHNKDTKRFDTEYNFAFKKGSEFIIAHQDAKRYSQYFDIVQNSEMVLKDNAEEKAAFLQEQAKDSELRHQRQTEILEGRIKQLEQAIERKDGTIMDLEQKVTDLQLKLTDVKSDNSADTETEDQDLPNGPVKNSKSSKK